MSNDDDDQEQHRWLGRHQHYHHSERPEAHGRAQSAPFMGERRYESHDAEGSNQPPSLPSWFQDEFLQAPYTASSIYQWPANYVTASGSGEDYTNMTGYASGSVTDNESNPALEEMIFQQQIAQFQTPFDENYPFTSISGGRMPESMHMRSDTIAGRHPGVDMRNIPAVSSGLILSSSTRASPSPVHASPATTPALPSVEDQGARAATPVRGKKRVRESSPPEEACVTPARADVKRLPQAMPRAKKTKTSSESSTAELKRTPDAPSGAGTPWSGRTPTPSPATEQAESTSNTVRRAGRKGPLAPGKRGKIEEVRSSGACWRCRRYKKPCNNRTGTCDTCLTSGFRIWPASLGCRRGDTQEFVDAILPSHLEEVLDTLPPDLPRPHTWRSTLEPRLAGPPSSVEDRSADKWDYLCAKILGTRLFAQEFVELFEIMAQYQRDAPREDPIFNLVAASLSYEVDFYHQFINLGPTTAQPNSTSNSPSGTVMSLRASLSNTMSTWLSLCLRGRMHDFPIAFIAATLMLCGLIIFSDTVAALKQLTGPLIWPTEAREQMITLRRELMTICLDLLGVIAKGAKPLRFRCWQREEGSGASAASATSSTTAAAAAPMPERSVEGMRLMSGNVHAFEAMASLQRWIRRWRSSLRDDEWFENPPFTTGIRPIQSLARFVRMSHGDFEEEA